MNILQNTILNLNEKLRGKIVKFSKKKKLSSRTLTINTQHTKEIQKTPFLVSWGLSIGHS